MKKIFPFLLIFPFFSLCACNRGVAHVIIMAGQSNMVGLSYNEYLRIRVGEKEFRELGNPSSNVKIMYSNWLPASINPTNQNSNFSSIKFGQGQHDYYFGPEIGIADVLSKTNEKYFLIKYAMSASSCFSEWNKSGDFYKSFKTYLNRALKKISGYNLKIDGFFWMQGEEDSKYEEFANLYEVNFTEMITDFRISFPQADVDIIDAGISDCIAWINYEAINNAKSSFDQSVDKHHYFSTIDLGLEYDKEPLGAPDIYHYDSTSMLELGRAFANNYLNLRNV